MSDLLCEAKKANKTVNNVLSLVNDKLKTNYKTHHYYSWRAGTTRTPATVQEVLRRSVINNIYSSREAKKILQAIEPPKVIDNTNNSKRVF